MYVLCSSKAANLVMQKNHRNSMRNKIYILKQRSSLKINSMSHAGRLHGKNINLKSSYNRESLEVQGISIHFTTPPSSKQA